MRICQAGNHIAVIFWYRGIMKTACERISKNIREILYLRALTLEQLAFEAEIDTGNLSRVLSGKRIPSLKLLQKIADALKVDVADLLRRT